MQTRLLATALLAALLSGGALAQGSSLPPVSDNDPIYGSQMMTPEERIEHRQKMRAATTLEEREKVRAEHHESMVKRAKERGITLPDEPPARGGRMMGPGGPMMDRGSRPGY